jgi:hypothetical protein
MQFWGGAFLNIQVQATYLRIWERGLATAVHTLPPISRTSSKFQEAVHTQTGAVQAWLAVTQGI